MCFRGLTFLLAAWCVGCASPSSPYPYPPSSGTITEYENYVRHNPKGDHVADARRIVLSKASTDERWRQLSEAFAPLADIDGASYDAENGRLILWGPESVARTSEILDEYEDYVREHPTTGPYEQARQEALRNPAKRISLGESAVSGQATLAHISGDIYDERTHRLILWGPTSTRRESLPLPPLLLDDFVVALAILSEGKDLGVSIGTVSGRVPTELEMRESTQRQEYPVEYIPPSIANTHLGSVLFEIDRRLKGLVQGEDNLTLQPVTSSVPGYVPLSRRLKSDTSAAGGFKPLGLWWFVPEAPEVMNEGYSIRFERYRMRVQFRAMTDDPAIAAFGEHLDDNFRAFAADFPEFRELVRLHKLVQVARWYHEGHFPDDELVERYHRLLVPTPSATKPLQTLVKTTRIPGPTEGSYYERSWYIMGGVDLSPPNQYVSASSLPANSFTLGVPASWGPVQPNALSQWSPTPYDPAPRSPVPIPNFARPVMQARPASTAYGWTVSVADRKLVAVSIPMRSLRSK